MVSKEKTLTPKKKPKPKTRKSIYKKGPKINIK